MNDNFGEVLFDKLSKNVDGLMKKFIEEQQDIIIPFWEYFNETNNSILSKVIFLDFYNDFDFLCDYLETNLYNNKAKIVKYINSQNDQGITALHYASYKGRVKIIKKLIELGADIKITNKKGLNVLHFAAQGNQPNSLAYFKEKFNEDLDSLDSIYSTPLHWACYTNSIRAIDYLLCNNIELNQRNNEGFTPLHLAIINDNVHIIKRLLRAGADKNIVDNNNRTPEDLAKLKQKKCLKIFKNKSFCWNIFIINTPIRKVNKSKKNIFLFIFLYIFSFITELVIILPNVYSLKLYFIFIFMNYLVFVIYFLLICNDPSVSPKNLINIIEILESGNDISFYCTKCKIEKKNFTVHCFICQKCIEDFDHHCYWIDNCVGKKNYILFILLLILNLVNFIIYFIIDILSFFRLKENKKTLSIIFLILNLFIIGIFSMLIIFLLLIQIRNSLYNIKLKQIMEKNRSKSIRSNNLFIDEKSII